MRHILLAALVLGSTGLYAQNQVINEELIPEGRMEQHQDFLADETPYPAKPRNMWAIGLHVGVPNISGDVKTRPIGGENFALGYGGYVRKALGYATSLRLGYHGGTAYGQNWERQSVGRTNDTLLAAGYDNPSLLDLNQPYDAFVHNYQTKYHNATLDATLNLNNLKFHKGTNVVSVFVAGGVGAIFYKTSYDALDANSMMYDFNQFYIGSTSLDNRKERLDAIDGILDGEYESLAEVDQDRWTLGDRGDETSVRFQTTMGGGLQFRLGGRVSLDLEHRVTLAFDDLLDGQRWERGGQTYTPDKDVLHYSSIGLSIHLGGSATEPSWFVNPMDYMYSELKEIQPPDMTDADGDGVVDLWDQELDTKEGYAVDTKGVTLDSDKDGCPDAEDPEPYSSPAYPIQDCQNVMPNFLSAAEIEQLVDNKLKPIMGGAGSNWFLPDILFDLNRDKIRPDAYDKLRYVSEVMTKYPTLQMQVTGHTDSRASEEYNTDLSRRRAEAAINHLAEQYGIDRGRFVMKYQGESSLLFKDARYESQHKMNRRVEFDAVQAPN